MVVPRRSPAEPPDPESLDAAWPTVLTAADPWAGDERLHDPAGVDDLLRHGALLGAAPLTPEAHASWDSAFLYKYGAILDGRAPWSATAEAARVLGLDGPRRHDKRPPRSSPSRLDDAVLAHIVEDRMPDVRVSLDRVLGPYADAPVPKAVRAAAAAVLGKLPMLRHGVRVFDRVLKDRPKPDANLRATFKAVNAAAAMLWRVDDGVPRPLLPLANRFAPTGPVAELADGMVFVGMMVPLVDGGWWPVSVIPLPEAPPASVLTRRLDLEVHRLRRHDRRFTWEDLLSDRPEVLYRTACEWTWMHTEPSAVHAAWSR